MQVPVSAQGVLQPRRFAFAGAARLRSLSSAAAMSVTILLVPATRITFFGP